MSHVLVTGATGFIGSHLVKALHEKEEKVVSLQHDLKRDSWIKDAVFDTSTVVVGDVRDGHFLKRVINQYRVDTVYHLAAQAIVKKSILEPLNTYDINVMGTVQVLEACRQLKVNNVIVQSTDKVYGTQVNAETDSRLIPTSPYDTSKIAADVIAQSYAKTYGMRITIVRPCNAYGLDDEDRIVPNTIRACMAGKSPAIYHNDHNLRQYIYVEDLASALVALKQHSSYTHEPNRALIVNVGTNDILDQEQVVLRILEFFPDLQPLFVESPRIKEIQSQSLVPSSIMDWTPKYDFEHGINRTLELWRKYFV